MPRLHLVGLVACVLAVGLTDLNPNTLVRISVLCPIGI